MICSTGGEISQHSRIILVVLSQPVGTYWQANAIVKNRDQTGFRAARAMAREGYSPLDGGDV